MTHEQVIVLEGVFAVIAKEGLFFSAVEILMAIEEYAIGNSFKE
jgi:hypothetical protein